MPRTSALSCWSAWLIVDAVEALQRHLVLDVATQPGIDPRRRALATSSASDRPEAARRLPFPSLPAGTGAPSETGPS
jgi:hypothetical protein